MLLFYAGLPVPMRRGHGLSPKLVFYNFRIFEEYIFIQGWLPRSSDRRIVVPRQIAGDVFKLAFRGQPISSAVAVFSFAWERSPVHSLRVRA